MTAVQHKAAPAVAQTRAFAELVAISAQANQEHNAVCTAYSQIEARVFAGEISKDDPNYQAAEAAEGEACSAATDAWCSVLEAPAANADEAITKFREYVGKYPINLDAPDLPIHGTPIDEDEALKRVLRDLRDHLLNTASADAELLALGEEFERRWEVEELRTCGNLTDDELNAVCAYTAEIADQIEVAYATTLAGYRVKARALAWRHCARNESLESPPCEAAQLLNDLIGQPRWTEDGELLKLGEQFKRLSREDHLLDGHTVHPIPAAVQARITVLQSALQSVREKARHLRATTPEALRIKAMIALDQQPTEGFEDFEDEAFVLARSLIADVLGIKDDIRDRQRDTFWIAEGVWPQDEVAEVEHAALLTDLGVTQAERVAA